MNKKLSSADEMTVRLIELSTLAYDNLPEDALMLARASLFDWLICGRAGRSEPVAQKLRQYAQQEEGSETEAQIGCSLFGGTATTPRVAAMVNGAISHALDYDDTHFAHVGHLSVGIYPAVMALAERTSATVDQLIAAFLVGAEAAVRTGCLFGTAHYNKGFHQTATAGTFGATLAAARLLKLNDCSIRDALGLCASRAAGLRSQFGTMGKPVNAGLAASNGLEAAQFAALGVTSADDGLLGELGFLATHTDAADAGETEASRVQNVWREPPPERFLFMSNSYKFHACCHGTHAMIEALLGIRETTDLAADKPVSIRLTTNPRWMSVCNIASPRTGLEVKFSYAWLAAMVFAGYSTADDRAYTDELVSDPKLESLARCVEVSSDPEVGDEQASGSVEFAGGRMVPFDYDLSTSQSVDSLMQRLEEKAQAVLGDEADSLLSLINNHKVLNASDIGQYMRQA